MTSAQPRANGRRDDGGPALSSVGSIPLTADTAKAAAAEQSIGSLVRDATAQLSTLLRAEIELARMEITGEVKKGLRGSVLLIIALVVLLLSFPFLFTAAAEAIAMPLPHWAQPWGGFAAIFILMLIITGLLAYAGIQRMRKIHAPKRTISTVRDTATALKRPGEPAA